MPPRKKTETEGPIDLDAKPKRSAVVPKTSVQWMTILETSRKNHWRRLQITIRMREWLLAGKPKTLDATKAMLKARGLDDQIEVVPIDDPEARAAAAEEVIDEGLCEFHRREGKPGLWYPTNHLKAMVKENWSVVGFRNEIRGSRGALAEGTFVYAVVEEGVPPCERDWIYLGAEPDGIYTAVAHTTGPTGPRSSIKRHEYMVRPTLTFELSIAHAVHDRIPDEKIMQMLAHAEEHGTGACRSQGFGKFDVLDVHDVTMAATPVVDEVANRKAG